MRSIKIEQLRQENEPKVALLERAKLTPFGHKQHCKEQQLDLCWLLKKADTLIIVVVIATV